MTVASLLRGGLPHLADVPVEPDAGTAREWAERELTDPVYHERPSLIEIVTDWLRERLAGLQGVAGDFEPRTAAIVVVAVVVVVGIVVAVVAGPVRRARSARPSTEVFADDTRTAAELRASADRLAAEGRWSEAVLDRFRAVLRSLEERAVLDERPGRTAHEAAEESGERFPAQAEDLRLAGRLFDDVCYGDTRATADDDARLRELDSRLTATRPALVHAPEPAEAQDGVMA